MYINNQAVEKIAKAFSAYKVGRLNINQLYKSIIAIGKPRGLTIKQCESITDRLINKY